jgi:hypothetical protein
MNYHDRKPPTITGRVERCRPARQGHRHDHVSPAALALAVPDVPLQFEAIQNQIRSAKLPLGSGVARVEQQ